MKPRDYRYDTAYESSPLQKKRRAERNAARAKMLAAGKVHKGQDVDHINGNRTGHLSNSAGNLRALSVHANRSKH